LAGEERNRGAIVAKKKKASRKYAGRRGKRGYDRSMLAVKGKEITAGPNVLREGAEVAGECGEGGGKTSRQENNGL